MNTLWGKRADWNVPFQGPSIWLLRVGGRADMKIWIEEFFSQTSGDRIFSPDVHRCRIFFQTYTTLKIFFFTVGIFFLRNQSAGHFFAEIAHIACVQTSPLPKKKIGRRNSLLPIFFWGRGTSVRRLSLIRSYLPQLNWKSNGRSLIRASSCVPFPCWGGWLRDEPNWMSAWEGSYRIVRVAGVRKGRGRKFGRESVRLSYVSRGQNPLPVFPFKRLPRRLPAVVKRCLA